MRSFVMFKTNPSREKRKAGVGKENLSAECGCEKKEEKKTHRVNDVAPIKGAEFARVKKEKFQPHEIADVRWPGYKSS